MQSAQRISHFHINVSQYIVKTSVRQNTEKKTHDMMTYVAC